jgi:hypothetical protein
MSTQTMVTRSTTFKIGWIILLVISVLFTLGHLTLMLVIMDEAPLFIGWAAYNAYSRAVLYIPSGAVRHGPGTRLGSWSSGLRAPFSSTPKSGRITSVPRF